jgi:DNA-binding response OmpR family regulator
MNEMKILLVDDDNDLRRAVHKILQQKSYRVIEAINGQEALQHYREADFVILDIMIPELDGFEVCKEIRKESSVPIILLTARGDIIDKKIGFSFGADDYLVKPFCMDELLLRIEAVSRRLSTRDEEKDYPGKEKISAGELLLDKRGRQTIIRGSEVRLTATEFDLLWLMASSPGRVFTRKQLFDSLWGEDSAEEPKSITVLIKRIREKIETDSAHPEYVLTVWGVGYKFAEMDSSDMPEKCEEKAHHQFITR